MISASFHQYLVQLYCRSLSDRSTSAQLVYPTGYKTKASSCLNRFWLKLLGFWRADEVNIPRNNLCSDHPSNHTWNHPQTFIWSRSFILSRVLDSFQNFIWKWQFTNEPSWPYHRYYWSRCIHLHNHLSLELSTNTFGLALHQMHWKIWNRRFIGSYKFP